MHPPQHALAAPAEARSGLPLDVLGEQPGRLRPRPSAKVAQSSQPPHRAATEQIPPRTRHLRTPCHEAHHDPAQEPRGHRGPIAACHVHRPPRRERLGDGHPVGVLEITAHRQPPRDARDRHLRSARGRKLPAARSSAVASPSRLGLVATITSRTPPCTRPLDQLRHGEIVRTHAVERATTARPARGTRRETLPPARWRRCPRPLPPRRSPPRSRRGSRQITHSASSVRLKHRSHGRTRSPSVSSVCASRRLCSVGCLSKW